MIFGAVPLAEAEGAILAHSEALTKGRLRKGVVLGKDDLARLAEAGIAEVTVARLEPDDVHEDAAAARLAAALCPDPGAVGLTCGAATTGRVNLHSAVQGIAAIDAAKIHAVNSVHPMITVATVPEWQRLGPRGMVATIKIIAYAVPKADLDEACRRAENAIAMRSATVRTAALVQSVAGDDDGEKGRKALADRLDRLGVSLISNQVVPHTSADMAAALQASDADAVFLLTGSATSDLRDTAPQALRDAGGVVEHYGIPVDPGNLLFYGHLFEKPVIGLPGCARSPALNGADWVMERMLCGVPVTPQDIAAMGVGGLLKEIPVRGRLRDG
ncbi:molybdopterin-binding protein [Pseudoprimorskyibacter insulae]|uniref:MoaB/Mog domain-containing protein n=1 Tax=Pseudoprimorskyibacter insulae TaxID=1695997 RepID=A0A2R8AX74_9RHOB|nr:molybdopterin-binding protein [Pseudoprimorskyibacter insulae]SPF80489.1 hypothetical protein PRI8871_02299 [Pseudoprimorskyibacter insulae]